MTATRAPAPSRPRPPRRPGLAAARLLRLELRHNAMLWMLPVAIALFWLTTYRKTMAMPPLWNMRAASMQTGALVAFACPGVGAAAWMGSRESRRRTADLVTITARPRSARQLTTWAATTGWAVLGYLGCVAVLYGVTAQQATWGGPLWWPAAVDVASLTALSAAGFAAGTLFPSRFTAPLAAVAAFFVLALSTQLIYGSQSYWQVSPVVAGAWDAGNSAERGDVLPVPARPGHGAGDVPDRAHRRGAGRPCAARGPRRAVAAQARRGHHRGRPGGGRDRRRPGRHRPDGRPTA